MAAASAQRTSHGQLNSGLFHQNPMASTIPPLFTPLIFFTVFFPNKYYFRQNPGTFESAAVVVFDDFRMQIAAHRGYLMYHSGSGGRQFLG
jgi:hypothetical protein